MRIVWLEPASVHLETIYELYAEKSIKAAANIYNDILDEVELLLNFPLIASIEPILEEFSKVYRSLIVRKIFKVVYFIEYDTIYISAVFDCRQDPRKLRKKIKE